MSSIISNHFLALIKWAESLKSPDGDLAAGMMRDLWNDVRDHVDSVCLEDDEIKMPGEEESRT
jgi:hypothetical protein